MLYNRKFLRQLIERAQKEMVPSNYHQHTEPFLTAPLSCQSKINHYGIFLRSQRINCGLAYFCKFGGDKVNCVGFNLAT
jgi:hypothetical protein